MNISIGIILSGFVIHNELTVIELCVSSNSSSFLAMHWRDQLGMYVCPVWPGYAAPGTR